MSLVSQFVWHLKRNLKTPLLSFEAENIRCLRSRGRQNPSKKKMLVTKLIIATQHRQPRLLSLKPKSDVAKSDW
jgi:hypothetical protein